MAIVQDAQSISAFQNNVTSTVGYNHAQGNLTQGIAIVGVTAQDATPNPSGVTYGGVAMTQVSSTLTTNFVSCSLWRLSLGTSSSGSKAVVASFGGANINGHFVSTVTFSGVDQTTPIGTPQGQSNFDTAAPSEARTPTITSAVGEICVAISTFCSSPTTAGSFTDTEINSALLSNSHWHGFSKKNGAATLTMSVTHTGSQTNSIIGVPLKPAASGYTIVASNTSFTLSGQAAIFRVGSPLYLRYRK